MKTVEKTEAEPPTFDEAMGELAAEIQRQARLGGTGLLDWLEERLDARAASRLIGIPLSTLYKLNAGTRGPIFEKLGGQERGKGLGVSGMVRYRRADLLSWLQSLRVDQVERIEGRARTTRRPVPVIGGSALNTLRHARLQTHRAS